MHRLLLLILFAVIVIACAPTDDGSETLATKEVVLEGTKSAEPTIHFPIRRKVPDFLYGISPEPYTMVTLTDYAKPYEDEGEQVSRILAEDGSKIGASQICAWLRPSHHQIIEVGDHWIGKDENSPLDRVAVYVNEIQRQNILTFENESLVQSNCVEAIAVTPSDKPNCDWSSGGSMGICWQADVGVGIHDVRFEFQRTSGKVTVAEWQFAIIDE